MLKHQRQKQPRRRKPPMTKDQFVVELFKIIDNSGLTLKQIEHRSKVTMQSMVNWRAGMAAPNFTTTRRLLDALGYQMAIKKKKED